MSEYVYFVTGLPDIAFDTGKPPCLVSDFVAEVYDRLGREDKALMDLVRRPVDNANLIRMIENRAEPFDPRGNYTREELEQVVKGNGACPDYMDAFLRSRREARVLFPGMNAEDTLAWLYQEEIDMHPNPFIREWGEMDSDIRNVLVVLNARKTGADPATLVVGRKGVADTVRKSTAPDLSLGESHPWAENLIAAKDNLLREKAADQIRWNWLEDMRIFSHFNVEALLAFLLQLFIVERWLKLEPGEGRRMLDKLTADLSAGLERFIPKL
jgi:hypothetical protein